LKRVEEGLRGFKGVEEGRRGDQSEAKIEAEQRGS